MSSALGKVKLADLAPTSQELEAGHCILAGASPTQARAKVAPMVSWLKKTPRRVSVKFTRRATPEVFWRPSWSTRCAPRRRKSSSSHAVDCHWWSQEKMDTEFGANEAATWRSSGLLPQRPSPLTGSQEPHMLEYRVPVEWERLSCRSLLKSAKTPLRPTTK